MKKIIGIARKEGHHLSKEILKKVKNWERNLGKIVKNLEKLVGSLGTFKQGSLGTLSSLGSFEPEFGNFLKIIWNGVATFCQHFDYVLKKTMREYDGVNLTTEKFLKFRASFLQHFDNILTSFWGHFDKMFDNTNIILFLFLLETNMAAAHSNLFTNFFWGNVCLVSGYLGDFFFIIFNSKMNVWQQKMWFFEHSLTLRKQIFENFLLNIHGFDNVFLTPWYNYDNISHLFVKYFVLFQSSTSTFIFILIQYNVYQRRKMLIQNTIYLSHENMFKWDILKVFKFGYLCVIAIILLS